MPELCSQDCCGRATLHNFMSPQPELPPMLLARADEVIE